jgi:hypothetical protein
MKVRRRISALVLLAGGLGAASCFTDNPPAYSGMLGPTRKEPEAGGSGAGTGGTAAGGGGKSEGGEAGAAAVAGRGGSAAGTGTSAGASAGNPPADPNFSPPCYLGPTVSGNEEIKKGISCTDEDTQLCYRSCGPNQVGWKTETCVAGVYAEGDCSFPLEKDYSCYRIPEEIDTEACGLTAAPAATDECTAPLCMTCNFDGFYADTGSDVKEGYCVCREPDAMGIRRWTCASFTAWPCPLNQGC